MFISFPTQNGGKLCCQFSGVRVKEMVLSTIKRGHGDRLAN